jgi:S-adenosylmethionine:tRNA ribosyltransferase-isomerase
MNATTVTPALTTEGATGRLSFDLPAHLEAAEPPEARGLTRDAVRMLVAERGSGHLAHTTFRAIPLFLRPGDLVVVNTSAVVPAAFTAWGDDGAPLVVHLSTRLDDGRWVLEPRHIDGRTTRRWDGPVPLRMRVGPDATITLDAPYLSSDRLWVAQLHLPQSVFTWLAAHGQPIRYGYVDRPWPIDAYQNVYATEPGSTEMPSAGRPFTPEVITRLVAKGVGVSPVVLHTGVASLEATERPYPERLRVPATTANRVNETRREGGGVIAVGTTVVRALETAGEVDGVVRPVDGWTDLVITPKRGVHVVDGLLTGWHEPEASHLLMLEAVAGRPLLEASYEASLQEGYLWHEFGDMHLILP